MGSIICNNSNIIKFNNNDREYLIDYLNLSGTKYNLDNENIIIFPTLFDKTLILKTKTKNEQEKALVRYIKNGLISEGTTVILDEDFTDKSYIKYVDAQILILISFGKKQRDLTVFLPFKPKETSTLITKQLLKQLTLLDTNITYKIANMWNKLKEIKYWPYLFSNSIPILILEISDFSLSEDFFRNFRYIIVKSIMEELSNNQSNEKINEIISRIKSLDILKQDKQNKTIYPNKKSKVKLKSGKNIEGIMYLSKQSMDNINQKNLNKQLHYPIMYPGEGPVYQFKRIIPNTLSVELNSKYINEDTLKLSQNQGEQKCLEEKLEALAVKIESYKSGLNELKQSYIETENKNTQDTISQKYLNPPLCYPITYIGNGLIYQFQNQIPNTSGAKSPKDISEKSILHPYWNNNYYRYMWYHCYPNIYSKNRLLSKIIIYRKIL